MCVGMFVGLCVWITILSVAGYETKQHTTQCATAMEASKKLDPPRLYPTYKGLTSFEK